MKKKFVSVFLSAFCCICLASQSGPNSSDASKSKLAQSMAMDPPMPDPNSSKPPQLTATDPPMPDPNSSKPPAALGYTVLLTAN